MKRLVRRNSYDEAIGEFSTAQRKDSFSSNNSKGNGSPKLVHMKRSRSGSISKKFFSQLGRDGSKKRTNRDPREYQKQPEETEATEEKQPEEKDDGYTVKKGNTSQQNKFLQKLTVDSPDSFERRNMSFNKGRAATVKERRSKAPSSMSQYSRRFDDMSSSRSSSRMHQHSCSITGTVQLVTD